MVCLEGRRPLLGMLWQPPNEEATNLGLDHVPSFSQCPRRLSRKVGVVGDYYSLNNRYSSHSSRFFAFSSQFYECLWTMIVRLSCIVVQNATLGIGFGVRPTSCQLCMTYVFLVTHHLCPALASLCTHYTQTQPGNDEV